MFKRFSLNTTSLFFTGLILTIVFFSMGTQSVYACAKVGGFGSNDSCIQVGMKAGSNAVQGGQAATDYWGQLKENALDPLAYALASQVSEKLVGAILTWANNGFEGNPFYLETPAQFAKNLAYSTATQYVDILRQDYENGRLTITTPGGGQNIVNQADVTAATTALSIANADLALALSNQATAGPNATGAHQDAVDAANEAIKKAEEDLAAAQAGTPAPAAGGTSGQGNIQKEQTCTDRRIQKKIDNGETLTPEEQARVGVKCERSGYTRDVLLYLGASAFQPQSDGSVSFTLAETIGPDWRDFEDEFEVGGWEGWEDLINDNNTPWSAYKNAHDELYSQAIVEKSKLDDELARNAGIQDQKECKRWKDVYPYAAEGELPEKDYCEEWAVTTPGDLIRNSLNNAANKGLDKLENSDEFGELLAMSLTNLVAGLAEVGLSHLKTSGESLSLNVKPPQASFEDIVDVASFGSSSEDILNGVAGSDSYDWLNIPLEVNIPRLLYGISVVEDTPQCSNGIDDDGDGFIDLGDIGCTNADDNSEGVGAGSDLGFADVNFSYEEEGMLDRLYVAINTVLLPHKDILEEMPIVLRDLDQQCVLGPDKGYKIRYEKAFQDVTSVITRRRAKDADDVSEKADIMHDRATQLSRFVKDYMDRYVESELNVFGTDTQIWDNIRWRSLVDVGVEKVDKVSELRRKLTLYRSSYSGLLKLASEYEALVENTERTSDQEVELKKVIYQIYTLSTDGSVPSMSEIDIERSDLEKDVATLEDFRVEFSECRDLRAGADVELRELLLFDSVEKLFCPYESISGRSGLDAIITSVENPEVFGAEPLYSVYRGFAEYSSVINGTKRSQLSRYNNNTYELELNKWDVPGYSFETYGPLELGSGSGGPNAYANDLSSNIPRRKDKFFFPCDTFYRSSLSDYQPFDLYGN